MSQALTDMSKRVVHNTPQCGGCVLMRLQLAVSPAGFEQLDEIRRADDVDSEASH
jgi:hypothetical protein